MNIIKKIFIVSTILLLVLLVFFGIYTVAFKKEDVEIIKKDKEEGFDIADVVSKKMSNITSDSVVAATIGPDGETIRYYDGLSGRAWTMTMRGTNKEVLSSETVGVPESVKWSSDGSSAILRYKNGETYVYNHGTNAQNKLRDGMDDVEWAGTGGKILYKYYDDELKERSLNIANSDGQNWKKLADLPYRFTDFVQIPSSILAAFWPHAESGTASELFTVSTISSGEPKKIFQELHGADYLFSPDGKRVLVSSSKDGGKSVTMGVMDSDGTNYTDLLIPTVVEKAVWSSDSESVYYALPNNVPEGMTWPDDYDDMKFTTKDTFFKLDVDSGKKNRIIELTEIKESVDAINLFLAPAEDAIFFINRENKLLYRLSL